MRISPSDALTRARTLMEQAQASPTVPSRQLLSEVKELIALLPAASRAAMESRLEQLVTSHSPEKLGAEQVTAHGTQALAEKTKGFVLGGVPPVTSDLDRRMAEIRRHAGDIEAAVRDIRENNLQGDDIARALVQHVRHPYFWNGYDNTWLTSGYRNTWLTSGYNNTAVTSGYYSVSDAVSYILNNVRENLAYDLNVVSGQ